MFVLMLTAAIILFFTGTNVEATDVNNDKPVLAYYDLETETETLFYESDKECIWLLET